MDDISKNRILNQLPTQSEVMQNNNNYNAQTPTNYIPPPIYNNNNIIQPNTNLEGANAYNNQLYVPVKIPGPEPMEVHQSPNKQNLQKHKRKKKAKQPVELLSVIPNKDFKRPNKKCPCDCCCYCDDCCECECCDCECCNCDECCNCNCNSNCCDECCQGTKACLECFSAFCQCVGACLSCLEIFK